jgi:hypothetical protein
MHSYAILICAPFPPFVTDPRDTQYAYLCTHGYRRDKEQPEQPLLGTRQAGAEVAQHVQMELNNELKPPCINPQTSADASSAISISGRKTNPKNTYCLSAYDLPSAENSPR